MSTSVSIFSVVEFINCMPSYENFPTTDYEKAPQKYYFISIAKNIIKIADLKNSKKTILDFGCGNKIFSKMLIDEKILNYDIKPEFTDHKGFENLDFDIVIFNHVFMYMSSEEIEIVLDKIKKINPNCKLILSLSSQNFLSKIGMFLTFNFNAHKNTRSSYDEQKEIFFKKTKLIKKKLSIFGITDIYYSEFKLNEK